MPDQQPASPTPRGRRSLSRGQGWSIPPQISAALDVLVGLLASASFAFAPQLGSIGVLLFLAILPIQLVRHPKYIFEVSAANVLLFAFPLLALASTFWSTAPSATMRAAIQLLLTWVVALTLANDQGFRRVHLGLAAGLGIYVISSLVLGHTISLGEAASADSAFGGLAGRKNITGHIATLACILNATAAFAYLKRDRRIVGLMVMFALVAYAEVVLSRSAGALIGCTLALGLIIAFENTRRVSIYTKAGAILAILVAALPLVFIWKEIQTAVFTNVLAYFGKDTGLTGRTHLWELADQLIAGKPWLGTGYAAFWIPGNPDAEGIWTWARLANRYGFNFHNSAREILVATGFTGLIVLVGSLLPNVLITLGRAIAAPTPRSSLALAVLAYQSLRFNVESVGPLPFGFDTVLLLLIICIDPAELRRMANQPAPAHDPRFGGAWVGASSRLALRQWQGGAKRTERLRLSAKTKAAPER